MMEKQIQTDKQIPVLYERKEDCCGCAACYAGCPHSAITMIEDEEGFEYPQIDHKKCEKCYLCLRVCPSQNVKNEMMLGSKV